MANITYTTSNTHTFGGQSTSNISASEVIRLTLISISAFSLITSLTVATFYFMMSSMGS